MKHKNLPVAIACAVAGIVATQFLPTAPEEQLSSAEIIDLQDADAEQLGGFRTRLIIGKEDPPPPPTKTLIEVNQYRDF